MDNLRRLAEHHAAASSSGLNTVLDRHAEARAAPRWASDDQFGWFDTHRYQERQACPKRPVGRAVGPIE
jgi:hypothetical protein